MKNIALFSALAALLSFSSCEEDTVETIKGCTDITANNYLADATEDDGSCTYDVEGCTDETAANYDANANIDNGSCTYFGENFAGTYAATEACGDGWEWEQVITSNGNEITIVSAFDWGIDITISVEGNSFSFTNLEGSIIYGGQELPVTYTTLSGEVSGNTIEMHYVIAQLDPETNELVEVINCEPTMTLSEGGKRYSGEKKSFSK